MNASQVLFACCVASFGLAAGLLLFVSRTSWRPPKKVALTIVWSVFGLTTLGVALLAAAGIAGKPIL